MSATLHARAPHRTLGLSPPRGAALQSRFVKFVKVTAKEKWQRAQRAGTQLFPARRSPGISRKARPCRSLQANIQALCVTHHGMKDAAVQRTVAT